MLKYTLKRILMLIPTVIGITLFIYLIMSLVPGDPVELLLPQEATFEQKEALRAEMGLDKPVLVQYVNYMRNVVRGDFGVSWFTQQPVMAEIRSRMPYTLTLGVLSTLIATIISIPLGTLTAVKHNSLIDYVVTFLCLLFSAMPGFWLGILLQIYLSLQTGWFPAYGVKTIRHFVLPVIAACAASVGTNIRSTRTWVLDVIRSDFVRTARAKGASEVVVILKHALRNALLPIITGLGAAFAGVLGGSVVIETVFAIPGISSYLTSAVKTRDMPIIMGCILVISVFVGIVNLLVDLMYSVIDPRVKFE